MHLNEVLPDTNVNFIDFSCPCYGTTVKISTTAGCWELEAQVPSILLSTTGIRYAEDVLKVLEQQALSAVSNKPASPSTSGQDPATAPAPASPVHQAEPSAGQSQQSSSTAQVTLYLLQQQSAVRSLAL